MGSFHMRMPQYELASRSLNLAVQADALGQWVERNEAIHALWFSKAADEICGRSVKNVMLAGPSSSGKTTSAHRLSECLIARGKRPVKISLDDYYMDRDRIPVDADGHQDLEHINTIDTDLFQEQLADLLMGREIAQPSFDFLTGRRIWKGNRLQLAENSVVIVEGLHALNPALLSDNVSRDSVFKLYVSPEISIRLDDGRVVSGSFLRLLRRIVRDFGSRGSSVAETLAMWESVRRGENIWILPFKEDSDMIFNSATEYELAVLKRYITPLLDHVSQKEPEYDQVLELKEILSFVETADADFPIPVTSLVREFIGGSCYGA